ncbi:hypothetical protein GQ55_6G275600 [Panicum hallii var. hallii]|uniref:Pentatricopeptide repeat-containing protein n=1 Tax=Panicum hallii var. hallii TaxID=1504633 RepID=A0A2T7DAA4_9POAL|nr:hypothetical protein GQ55_6G275600 [Panicum hallii var. hallii]
MPASSTSAASTLLPRCRSLAAVKQLHDHFLSHSNRPFPYNHFLSKLLSLLRHGRRYQCRIRLCPPPPLFPPAPHRLLIQCHVPLLCHLAPGHHPSPVPPHAPLRAPPRHLHASPSCSSLPRAAHPERSLARSAHALLEKLGLRGHDHTVHSLITMYSYLGDHLAARRVFDGIPHHYVVS